MSVAQPGRASRPGTVGGPRGYCVRGPARGREAHAARARRRCARARSTRRSYVDHRLDTHDRGTHLRRRARERARSADRAVARRHAVGAHVVPPARGAPEGRVPHDRVRPPRPRPVGARRGRVTRSRTSAEDVKTVLERLDLHDAVLVGHSMGGVAVQSFVIRYPEIAARARRRHRAAVDARVHAVRIALDADEDAAREAHEARRPTRSGCGTARTSGSSPRASASASARTRVTSSSCAR